jgi:hypothetical protein
MTRGLWSSLMSASTGSKPDSLERSRDELPLSEFEDDFTATAFLPPLVDDLAVAFFAI